MTTNKLGRRTFTDEFKADAVHLVIQSERPIVRVARELEINETAPGYWVKQYRQIHSNPAVAPTPIDAARHARIEAENRHLVEKNAFLKKAAFFAKE